MNNLLFLGFWTVVFACHGSCTPIKEKPPDQSENVTQLINAADAVPTEPNKPSTFRYPEKLYPNLPVREENQTVERADVNSDILANLSLPESLFTSNDSAYGHQRVTDRNSSVRSESRLSLEAKLGDYSPEKDRLGITPAEVNDSVELNSSMADNSNVKKSSLLGDQEAPYIAATKNKTSKYQDYSNFTEGTGNVTGASNDSVGSITTRLTSEEVPRNLSEVVVQVQPANGSAFDSDIGHDLTPSPGNRTRGTDVLGGNPAEILRTRLDNSSDRVNGGNWSHPSCVKGSDGLNRTNCSTPDTKNSNLTREGSVNDTTGVAAYIPVIHQVNTSGTSHSTEEPFRLILDQMMSNNSDLSTTVLKSKNSVVRTSNDTTVNVTQSENRTAESTRAPSGGTGRHKSYVISSQMKQHYKGVVQTILLEGLKHGVWESKVPIEDGPFGSLIWRDKKYLISVLVPIGVGITGAVIIVVVAYAVRSYKRKQKRRAFTSPSRTFRPQAQLAIMDQILLLDDSSDDEF